ncbi:MAG TPA: sulfurtransferase [Myxococcota bacterium]|nr:sulfurtransferase [Myxococcota bacterium]
MSDKLLVAPEELAEHLDDPGWVVIDTRHDLMDPPAGRHAYEAGHIPGAFFLALDDELSGPKTGANGRHPLPDPGAFAARVNRCGVDPGTRVVVYDDLSGGFALRLWWMLRWLGHDAVSLLDGGLALWRKQGRALSTEVPAPRAGSFAPRAQLGATVDVHFLERFHAASQVTLLDARNAERFEGRQETIDPVAGHVPGALNRPWQSNLAPDGRFQPAARLREEFERILGAAPPSQVVHMCGSGVTACHNLFAMELAGLPGSRLYPGSWSEWCADRARPVATGP